MHDDKSPADAKLIQKLFGFHPLDHCRRENGDLVFLNPQGQKFVYSERELRDLTARKVAGMDAGKAPAAKPAAAAPAKSAESAGPAPAPAAKKAAASAAGSKAKKK